LFVVEVYLVSDLFGWTRIAIDWYLWKSIHVDLMMPITYGLWNSLRSIIMN